MHSLTRIIVLKSTPAQVPVISVSITCYGTLLTLQVFQETAVPHQFGDDVDGLILRTHCVQLDQLRMSQLLHYLRFSEEIFWIHRPCYTKTNQSQHSNISRSVTCTNSDK